MPWELEVLKCKGSPPARRNSIRVGTGFLRAAVAGRRRAAVGLLPASPSVFLCVLVSSSGIRLLPGGKKLKKSSSLSPSAYFFRPIRRECGVQRTGG